MSFLTTVLSQSKSATGARLPFQVPAHGLFASMIACSRSRLVPYHARPASSFGQTLGAAAASRATHSYHGDLLVPREFPWYEPITVV